MADLLPFLLYVHNRNAVQLSPIGWLTAPFGVEGGSVQDHGPVLALSPLLQNPGFEVREAGVFIVQSFCHGFRLNSKSSALSLRRSRRDKIRLTAASLLNIRSFARSPGVEWKGQQEQGYPRFSIRRRSRRSPRPVRSGPWRCPCRSAEDRSA